MSEQQPPPPGTTGTAAGDALLNRLRGRRVGGGNAPDLFGDALGNVDGRIAAAQPGREAETPTPTRAERFAYARGANDAQTAAAQAPSELTPEPTPAPYENESQRQARWDVEDAIAAMGAQSLADGISEATGQPLTEAERISVRERFSRVLAHRLPRILGGKTIGEYLSSSAKVAKAMPGAMLKTATSPKELAKMAAVGGVTGLLKTGAKLGISQLGMFSSLGVTVGAAAGAGALYSAGREVYKQFKTERNGDRRDEWREARDNHRNLITASWSYADKQRIGKAALRGAVKGAIGAAIGFEIADLGVFDSLGHAVADKVGQISNPLAGITVPAPIKDAGALISDKFNAGEQFVADKASDVGKFVSETTQAPRDFVADKFEGAKGLVGLGNDTTADAPVYGPPAPAPIEAAAPVAPENLSAPAVPEGLTPDQEKAWEAYKSEADANATKMTAAYDEVTTENNELRRQIAEYRAKAGGGPAIAAGVDPEVAAGVGAPASGPSGVPGAGAAASATGTGAEAGVGATTGVAGLPKEIYDIPGVEKTADGLVYSLPAGSNPWEVARKAAGVILNENHQPLASDDLRLNEITKKLLESSSGYNGQPGVGGVWGLSGEIDHQNIPPGYKLVFDKDVLSTISKFKK